MGAARNVLLQGLRGATDFAHLLFGHKISFAYQQKAIAEEEIRFLKRHVIETRFSVVAIPLPRLLSKDDDMKGIIAPNYTTFCQIMILHAINT